MVQDVDCTHNHHLTHGLGRVRSFFLLRKADKRTTTQPKRHHPGPLRTHLSRECAGGTSHLASTKTSPSGGSSPLTSKQLPKGISHVREFATVSSPHEKPFKACTRVWKFLILGLALYTVLDGESDFQVKICQFRRRGVEYRESRVLIVRYVSTI